MIDHNENDDSKNFSMLCKDLLNWSSFSILVLIANLNNPWFCASSKKKTFLSFKVPRWNDLNWGVPETTHNITNVSRKFAIYDKYLKTTVCSLEVVLICTPRTRNY